MIIQVPHFCVGVDLGQKCDFTTIAIVERRFGGVPHYLTPWTVPPTRYLLRHLERVALGTPYPRVVRRITEITHAAPLRGRSSVVVDATGVGAPVVDLLRTAELQGDLIPVTITGGEHAGRSHGSWNVPKRDLVTTLQVMIEQEELEAAQGLPERRRLVEELMGMRRRAGRFGAAGSGHDDLVLAVALGCWWARRGVVGERGDGRVV